jgi:hypothetical protein
LTDEQLLKLLKDTAGGQNVIRAGLEEDIHFAARRNSLDVAPRCDGHSLTIRKMLS